MNTEGDFDGDGGDPIPPQAPTADVDVPPREATARVDKTRDTSKPKTGPPTADEWQDFIGRIVMRSVCEAFVSFALRDCELTEREEREIYLGKEDYAEFSAPFASLTAQTKWSRKHGRVIVNAVDSWEAVVAMGIWMRRVQKIARRHAPERARAKAERQVQNHLKRQERQKSKLVQAPTRRYRTYQDAAFHPDDSPLDVDTIQERIRANGRAGADSGEGIIRPRPPDGPIVNPGTA